MAQAPRISAEQFASAPEIAPLEVAPKPSLRERISDRILAFSMRVHGVQQKIENAPVDLAVNLTERTDLSDEAKEKIVKVAASAGVAAVAFSQRKLLGEVIGDGFDGLVDMVTDAPGAVAALPGEVAENLGDLFEIEHAGAQEESTTTTTEDENTTTTTEASEQETTTTTEPETENGDGNESPDEPAAEPEEESTPEASSDDEASSDTPTLEGLTEEDFEAIHEDYRNELEANFVELANDQDYDGEAFYNPEAHLDADGNPISIEDYAASLSDEELEAHIAFAREYDELDPLSTQQADAYIGGDEEAQEYLAGLGELSEEERQEELSAVIADNEVDAYADFDEAASGTVYGDALYDPADHEGMTAIEYAQTLSPDEARAAADALEQIQDMKPGEYSHFQHFLETADENLETDDVTAPTVEPQDGNTADSTTMPQGEPSEAAEEETTTTTAPEATTTTLSEAYELYGEYADNEHVSITVNNGQTLEDAIIEQVNEDMPGLSAAQRANIAENLMAITAADDSSMVNENESTVTLQIAIPQTN